MNDPGAFAIWTTITPYAVALVAAFAALTAAFISHSVKISEFRQTWINELRKDISEYIGLAHEWYRKWDELNYASLEESKAEGERDAFLKANSARVILWRIRMRINPRNNLFKAEDDRFLQSLLDLLDPSKISPSNPDYSWIKLADQSVELGRELVKREWEVAKRFPLFRR